MEATLEMVSMVIDASIQVRVIPPHTHTDTDMHYALTCADREQLSLKCGSFSQYNVVANSMISSSSTPPPPLAILLQQKWNE